MITLLIKNNINNNTYTNNDNINWSDGDSNTWNTYYKNNCPINKTYDLSKYKDNLNDITISSTVKNHKYWFTINDLLSEIDSSLLKAHVDIPNNFFSYLPLNPAINIKINNENALLSTFIIKLPKYKEKSKMNIEIITSDVGPSYHLQSSNIKFNFTVKNELPPNLINIDQLHLDNINKKITMIDITHGSKNEVIAAIESSINDAFIKKINDCKPWRNITNNDFIINYDNIKNLNNYKNVVGNAISITASADNNVINGKLNFMVYVQGVNTIKSLSSFKTTLETNQSLINESLIVDDAHLIITKLQIEKKINLLLTKIIRDYGLKTWHQIFNDDDYTITTNAIDNDYYVAKPPIQVVITGKNQLKDTINININFKTFFLVKSLLEFKQYLNKNDFIHPEVRVNNDKKVQKDEIDNYLIGLFDQRINHYGLKTWEQYLKLNDDYTITTDFKAGNYQSKLTTIQVFITGKNQLKDNIIITVFMKCLNKNSNEQIFPAQMQCNLINPISLKPNDDDKTNQHYIIEGRGQSSVDTLLGAAKQDLIDFPTLDSYGSINFVLHSVFVMDDDDYKLDFQSFIDPIIIKNAFKIELVTNCIKKEHSQFLNNMDITILYKDENDNTQELKMSKEEIFINLTNDCQLHFINLSTIITIKSFR